MGFLLKSWLTADGSTEGANQKNAVLGIFWSLRPICTQLVIEKKSQNYSIVGEPNLGVILGINSVYQHLGIFKWPRFLWGKNFMHSESCDRVAIFNILVYRACNDIRTMAIHGNQKILQYLNLLLNSLQIWLYHIFQNVSNSYLTKIHIIWMCLEAYKLQSSTKWLFKPMSLNIQYP
jgi:hypothetical protein